MSDVLDDTMVLCDLNVLGTPTRRPSLAAGGGGDLADAGEEGTTGLRVVVGSCESLLLLLHDMKRITDAIVSRTTEAIAAYTHFLSLGGAGALPKVATLFIPTIKL